MPSSLSTTPSSASLVAAKRVPGAASLTPTPSLVSFRLSSPPNLHFLSRTARSPCTLVKAQLNEVAVDESSIAATSTPPNSQLPPEQPEDRTNGASNEPPPPTASASQEAISEFISQVSSLVKLVDSNDIVELQLKQLDCELLIRKKEAMPLPPSPSPQVAMYSPPPPPPPEVIPSPSPPVSAATPVPPPQTPSPSPSPALASSSSSSSRPTIKCPMAGTFYRSPAPGTPPFVKVGDKVQTGQVLCIVEAMKLMNEIEATQSGTIVEILAEDGKPVSVDTDVPSLSHPPIDHLTKGSVLATLGSAGLFA
ncbi:hypothetical protein Tsubulata_025305, partial [Turnera subulata]